MGHNYNSNQKSGQKSSKAARYIEEAVCEISGYKFGPTIGHGSYSKVKLGFSENERRKVAIKILDLPKLPTEFTNKFLPRELEIIKTVQHPNIAKVYEIVTIDKKIYIVMEFASHGTLLEYINLRGSLSENHSRKLFKSIVNAIDYLHKKNIVHRDLKCENIMLDVDNNIKLTDFGFARYFQENDLLKTYCGSAAYVPPEILKGLPYIPVLHDTWALGVILYNMICASMPFDDTTIKKTISEQEKKVLDFNRRKNVSELCKNLILGILNENMAVRFRLADIIAHPWMTSHQKSPGTATDPGATTSEKAKKH